MCLQFQGSHSNFRGSLTLWLRRRRTLEKRRMGINSSIGFQGDGKRLMKNLHLPPPLPNLLMKRAEQQIHLPQAFLCERWRLAAPERHITGRHGDREKHPGVAHKRTDSFIDANKPNLDQILVSTPQKCIKRLKKKKGLKCHIWPIKPQKQKQTYINKPQSWKITEQTWVMTGAARACE